ncbi:hypothetical protein B0H14DRAFT_2638086 [Mycena olivaceomarginata]|nr:hypothetical protein B0H14DRAFT_2638086 [Mycena olivaceomarginata]
MNEPIVSTDTCQPIKSPKQQAILIPLIDQLLGLVQKHMVPQALCLLLYYTSQRIEILTLWPPRVYEHIKQVLAEELAAWPVLDFGGLWFTIAMKEGSRCEFYVLQLKGKIPFCLVHRWPEPKGATKILGTQLFPYSSNAKIKDKSRKVKLFCVMMWQHEAHGKALPALYRQRYKVDANTEEEKEGTQGKKSKGDGEKGDGSKKGKGKGKGEENMKSRRELEKLREDDYEKRVAA